MTELDTDALRARREELGLTQAALARRVGLGQPAVSRLESGDFLPPIPVLERIAAVLRMRLVVGFAPAAGGR